MYLAVSFRGQAQGVFDNITDKSHDYTALIKALEERFAPPNQTELYRVQLRERRQKSSETLSELGQDIRRLTNLAYPTAPSDLRRTLSKEQFFDALVSTDMRIRIKQARPVNLNDAIRHAVELEAYNRAERKHLEGQGFMRTTAEKVDDSNNKLEDDMKQLQKTVADLHKSFETWKQQGKSTYHKSVPKQRNTPQQQKPKCYNCGSEDHLQFRCPSNKRNKRNTRVTEESEKHQTKYVANKSSGLYIDCKINSIPTECLIDTGATLSIISIKAWDIISQNSSMTLQTFKSGIYTASGSPIDVKGKISVMVEVGGIKCVTEMVVADIDIDAILGLDFLKSNNCQLDMDGDTLLIKGKTCKLNVAGKIGCYRITVAKDIEIPSRSEVIIEGKVHMPILRKNDLAVVEPTKQSFITGKGIVAKALVHTKDTVPLRLMNLGYESEKVYTGTHVANLSLVSSVHSMEQQESTSSTLVKKYQNT